MKFPGPRSPFPTLNPPAIRCEGYGSNVEAAVRRAAMKGLKLGDPAHRVQIRAALRAAQLRDLRAEILGRLARGDGPGTGGDAA